METKQEKIQLSLQLTELEERVERLEQYVIGITAAVKVHTSQLNEIKQVLHDAGPVFVDIAKKIDELSEAAGNGVRG